MRRSIALAGAVASILAGVAGCGGTVPPTKLAPGQLTLSSIRDDGAPMQLTDGQDVTLVEGAQGGFHVWMKFRAHDVPEGGLTLQRTAHRLSDDKLVLRTQGSFAIGAPDAAGDWEVHAPLPMFMCPSPVGLSVVDLPIVFRIALTDGAGNPMAAEEVTLVPHCPDAEADFCERICTG